MEYKKSNKKANSRFTKLKGSNSVFGSLFNKLFPQPKTSQIALFVILGVLIVIAIVIIFLLIRSLEVRILDEDNPQAFVESCTREAVEKAIAILSRQGGDIKPKGAIMHDTEEISFLCFNYNFYEPCINQRPLLIEHIENEITDYIKPIVSDCFFNLESSLRKRYDIETSQMDLKTILKPKTVTVEINKFLKLTRKEEVRDFESFKMVMAHPIYNLAEIAITITNQESRYCNFDELGYMVFYPEYDIKKFERGDSNIIYKITERATEQNFNFAIRSCPLPPGY